MMQPNIDTPFTLSESFYEDCIKFASRIIRLERRNLFAQDIVHDLIVETDINYQNYQKKIRCRIINERNRFQPLSIESVNFKTPPFKTNEDFTCAKCKNISPVSEMKRYFSSKGFYVERSICKCCNSKVRSAWGRKQTLQKTPYWVRKLERDRRYYKEHQIAINKKKNEYYNRYIKKPKVKIDWAKEKLELSDKYITKLLLRKYKKSEITEVMILEKRNSILYPTPKKTKEEIRQADYKRRMEKYRSDPEYREKCKKQVSEYTKANKEKRRLSKLRLKENRMKMIVA